MMLLVEAFIQRAQMKDPVGAVEEGLAGEHANEKIPYEFFQRRELRVDSDAWRKAFGEGCVYQSAMEGKDNDLIPNTDYHGVEDLA